MRPHILLFLAQLCAASTVIVHYMESLSLTPANIAQDIIQITTMNIDVIALNVYTTATSGVDVLVQQLYISGTCLIQFCISVDMTQSAFNQNPSAIVTLLSTYMTHPCYFNYKGRPYFTTYKGGYNVLGATSPADVNTAWKTQVLNALAPIVPYFIPKVDDAMSSGGQTIPQLYPTFSAADGLGLWETAWPGSSSTPTNVSSSKDTQMIRQAAAYSKSYLMVLSTFQFKHNKYGNWLRPGEMTLPIRFQEILTAQPDLVEIVTWNDLGEGHNIGIAWPTFYGATNFITTQTQTYQHTGWQPLIRSFIAAYKSQTTVMTPAQGYLAEGAFWYRQMLLSDICNNDPYGRPSVFVQSADTLTASVVLSTTMPITITSGSQTYNFVGPPGLSYYSVPLSRGNQSMSVGGVSIGQSTNQQVVWNDCTSNNGVYNYNYQVVGLTPVGSPSKFGATGSAMLYFVSPILIMVSVAFV